MTLLKPFGKRVISLTEVTIDFSLSAQDNVTDDGVEEEDRDVVEENEAVDLIDVFPQPTLVPAQKLKHDPQVLVDGSYL